MQSPKLAVIIGHSHIGAITHAVANREATRAPDRGSEPGLHVALYEAWRFKGNPPFKAADAAGHDVFNPDILAAVEAIEARHGPAAYMTVFGGNAHSVLAMVRHARPFDFVLPDSDLPLDPTAEVVPLHYVEKILQGLMDPYLYQLYLLQKAAPRSVYAFDVPPVNGDNAYVAARLDAAFGPDKGQQVEISPRTFRRKMWLLHRRLQARICAANGITLVAPPAASMTPDGFLDPLYYGPDATHAGDLYGELVLQQIESVLGARMNHWSAFS